MQLLGSRGGGGAVVFSSTNSDRNLRLTTSLELSNGEWTDKTMAIDVMSGYFKDGWRRIYSVCLQKTPHPPMECTSVHLRLSPLIVL